MINGSPARKEDKIKLTANDVAQQRHALKKAGICPANAPAPAAAKKRGRPKGPTRKPKAGAPAAARAATASPVDLIDKMLLDLAHQCGGIGELKRLVDRIASVQVR